MTDTPRTEPPAPRHHQGRRGLDVTWQATARAGRWLKTRWEELVAALQDAEPAPAPTAPPPRPGRLVERRTASAPLPVPAQDDVFHFVVHATFTWSSRQVSADVLSRYAQAWTPQASQRVRRAAARISRTLPATQTGKLEVALQDELTRQGRWTCGPAEARATCTPEISVELDEQVRDLLRPYGEHVIRAEREYAVHRLRAESAERICRQWLTVLELFVESPAADTVGPEVTDDLISAVQQVKRDAEAAAEWSRRLREAGPVDPDLLHPHAWFDRPASPAQDDARANGRPDPVGDPPTADDDQVAAADSGSSPNR